MTSLQVISRGVDDVLFVYDPVTGVFNKAKGGLHAKLITKTIKDIADRDGVDINLDRLIRGMWNPKTKKLKVYARSIGFHTIKPTAVQISYIKKKLKARDAQVLVIEKKIHTSPVL